MSDKMTANSISQYQAVLETFNKSTRHTANLVPHAPYSVSRQLLNHINSSVPQGATISIHNQETPPEDELFLSATGGFHDFYKSFDLNLDYFKATDKTAIHYILDHFAQDRKTLFVHNTLSSADDIIQAKKVCKQVYWATCPNANLYIENRLPDYRHFLAQNAKVCIGTDSLTSNWQLDIFEEIKTIKKYKSYLLFETLVEWACKNGAEALGFDDQLGTIEKGKTPGLVFVDAELYDEEPDISDAMSTRLI